jgi:hypothetical protein
MDMGLSFNDGLLTCAPRPVDSVNSTIDPVHTFSFRKIILKL